MIDELDPFPIVNYLSSSEENLENGYLDLICQEGHITRLGLVEDATTEEEDEYDYLRSFFKDNKDILDPIPHNIETHYFNLYSFLNINNSYAAGVSMRRIIEEFLLENYILSTLNLPDNAQLRDDVEKEADDNEATLNEEAFFLIGGATETLKLLSGKNTYYYKGSIGEAIQDAVRYYINNNPIGKKRKLSKSDFKNLQKAHKFASQNAHGREFPQTDFIGQLKIMIPILRKFFSKSDWEGYVRVVK